jgi:molybdate transport system regulatory protein
MAISPGKADLLEAIAESGSIAAAGRSMGMSYKRAWYLLDTMNRCFREPLVLVRKGGRHHGGTELTATGKQVLTLFRAIEKRAIAANAAELEAFADLIAEIPPATESATP